MNERYLNAIGDQFDAIGEEFNAGGEEGGLKMASLPYILTIQNGTTANITNVPIFNSAVYCRNTSSLPAGVTYSISNFNSYDAFLFQVSVKPFTVGRTYWTSTSSTQVQDISFLVINKLADGKEQRTPIIPEFNKFANQNTVNDDFTTYIVDSNTELYLSTLYASTTIMIRFYYSETVDIKRALSGRPTTQSAQVGGQGLVVTNR